MAPRHAFVLGWMMTIRCVCARTCLCLPAVVRLCAWLRSAGVELGDAGKRLSVEGRERVSQRRMLHDEIHSLRQVPCPLRPAAYAVSPPCRCPQQERDSLASKVDALEDELLQTKSSTSATLRRRDAEITDLTEQLKAMTDRAEAAGELATELETSGTDARAQAAELREKLASAQAAISASTEQSERAMARIGELEKELAEVRAVLRRVVARRASLTCPDGLCLLWWPCADDVTARLGVGGGGAPGARARRGQARCYRGQHGEAGA